MCRFLVPNQDPDLDTLDTPRRLDKFPWVLDCYDDWLLACILGVLCIYMKIKKLFSNWSVSASELQFSSQLIVISPLSLSSTYLNLRHTHFYFQYIYYVPNISLVLFFFFKNKTLQKNQLFQLFCRFKIRIYKTNS